MKSKYKFLKHISVFILALSVCFSQSFIVLANDNTHGGGGAYNHTPKTFLEKTGVDMKTFVSFIARQFGAVVTFDVAGAISNHEDLIAIQDEYLIGYDEDTKDITISPDLVKTIKQALQEYADENEGYYIVTTASPNLLDAPSLYSKPVYDTIVNLTNKYGLIAIATNTGGYSLTVGVVDTVKNSFVAANNTGTTITSSTVVGAYLYDNATWGKKQLSSNEVYLLNLVNSGSETGPGAYEDLPDSPVGSQYYFNYFVINNALITGKIRNNTYKTADLISSDGRRVAVFKSYDAFVNHSINKRAIYYSTDYYEKEPTTITVDLATLENGVNDINAALDKLLSKIDKDTPESNIEKLLQEILDEMKGNGGSEEGGGSGSGGSSTDVSGIESLLDKIQETLSGMMETLMEGFNGIAEEIGGWGESIAGQLTTISEQLGFISYQIGNMTTEEVDTKTDNAISELWGVFAEVGDVLKTKFPFSIPWDIHSLLAKLGGTQAQTASYSAAGGISLYADEGYNPGMTGRPIDQWVEGAERAQEDAPKFEIPFVIESIGIESKIVIDLINFEPVSKISRVMWTLVYCGVLIKLTFAVVALIHEILYD